MRRAVFTLIVCAAVSAACSGGTAHTPTGPSVARAPRLARTRFLAFGDSLTAGEVTAPIAGQANISKLVVVPAASYPSVLQGALQSAYRAQADSIIVVNEGRGGETLYDGNKRFDSVFTASRPEAVLLQEGVNGVAVDGPDASTEMMRQMVRRAKDGNAVVFVGSMLPTLANRQRTQNRSALESYDTALQTMCAQEGVTYVDLYNGMLPQADQLIGIDGLHPTEAGYRRIAEIYFAAIKQQLEQ